MGAWHSPRPARQTRAQAAPPTASVRGPDPVAGHGSGPGLPVTLALTTSIQIVATAAALSLTAIMPLVAADVAVDTHFVGYQISLIYLSGIVSAALSGKTIRRIGASRLEEVCLLTFALGLLCFAMASVSFLVVGSLLIGVGYGYQNPAASQLLIGITPERSRNLVYSVKQAGVPLGGVVASLAFPAAALLIGWREALAVSALVPLALIVAVRLAHRGQREDLSAIPRTSLLDDQKMLFAEPALATLALLSFLYSAVQLSLSAFTVTALVEDAGWRLVAAGSIAAATQAAGAFGRIGWGIVADRMGGGFRLLGFLGIAGAALWLGLGIALANEAPAPVTVTLFVLSGVVWLGWNGVMLAETARKAPEGRVGAATGAVLVYTFLGVLVGPSSFAFIAGATGSFAAAFALFALFGVAGLAAVLVARLR